MKEKQSKNLVAIFVLGLLVLSAFALMNWKNASGGVIKLETRGIAHAPIHINGDADFANQTATEGWPGNGSQDNPYVIDGYDIDGNGGSYCIWIEN
ncbi:MAG: hypothetical protein ACP5LE_07445, partial [Thermoplasmata archaeon]